MGLLCRFNYLLICHFLLNLQDVPNVTIHGANQTLSRSDQGEMSTICFNTVLGNIGAPLRDGTSEDDGDEDSISADAEMAQMPQSLSSNDEEKDVDASSGPQHVAQRILEVA